MGKRHQVVTPDKANQVLDISLVVALAGPTEAVLEQIMRPQLAEDVGAPPVAVAQDSRGRGPGAGPITENRAVGWLRREKIPMAVPFGYNRSGFERYLGDVSLIRRIVREELESRLPCRGV